MDNQHPIVHYVAVGVYYRYQRFVSACVTTIFNCSKIFEDFRTFLSYIVAADIERKT